MSEENKIYVGDTCGFCPHNDGLVYASCPVMYKCTFTNEYHYAMEKCNVECTIKENKENNNE